MCKREMGRGVGVLDGVLKGVLKEGGGLKRKKFVYHDIAHKKITQLPLAGTR